MTGEHGRREVHEDDAHAIQRWLDEGGRDLAEKARAVDQQDSIVSVEEGCPGSRGVAAGVRVRQLTWIESPARSPLPLAAAFAVAGVLVVAVNGLAPFPHGLWLAAYLILVGGVSQAILSAVPNALGLPRRSSALVRLDVVLWNTGSLAVPIGVLLDRPIWVTLGSAALLSALARAASQTRRADAARHRATAAYQAVLLGLAVSTVVGSALAHAPPGTWL